MTGRTDAGSRGVGPLTAIVAAMPDEIRPLSKRITPHATCRNGWCRIFTVTMIYPGFVATGIRENATGPDGKPILVSPVKEGEVMSVEDCSRRIVRAVERREREVIMTARGKMGQWLKLIAPAVVDRIAKRAVEKGR